MDEQHMMSKEIPLLGQYVLRSERPQGKGVSMHIF